MHLSGHRLHNRHLPELRLFARLRVLNLAHNRLSSLADLGLPFMAALEQLDVHDNALRWGWGPWGWRGGGWRESGRGGGLTGV